jgi:hypothetical protein
MKYKNPNTFIAVLLSFALLLCANSVRAMDLEESSAYASFIKDIVSSTKIVKKGKFCVFGSDEVAKALMYQNPQIIKIGDEGKRSYDKCNSIYISQGMERGLRIELDKLIKKKILTIAIFDGFTNMGGMIQVQLGRRNFELTVNSNLLKAASVKLDVLATNLIIN